MYRIITVDLDGTLLSPDNKITKYTKKVITLLIDQGLYVIFASGRHHIDMMRIRDSLNIKIFMITSNGAKVYNLNNKLIFENNLDIDIASKLTYLQHLDVDVITQVYRNNQWYINNSQMGNNFFPDLSSMKHKYFHPHTFDCSKVSKIFYTSNNFKKLYDLEKYIINLFHTKVNVSFADPGCLEVISGKTSKGYGLKLISDILGISLKKCITFGNGMNDYDMLNISGKPCIMENSDPRLKKSLPYAKVIGHNKDDSVAVFLEKMFIKSNY